MTNSVSAAVVIPARYASTRFPGKPLARQSGKFLIQHVVEQAAYVVPCVVGQKKQAVPVSQTRPHAALYVAQVPAWHATAAAVPETIDDPSWVTGGSGAKSQLLTECGGSGLHSCW